MPPYGLRRLPLTIVNGEARFGPFTGAVGPNGDLEMRYPGPQNALAGIIYEVRINGSIDSTSTVHARRVGYGCSYDVVWKKVTK
jgi:hypothetical protein